MKFEAVVFDYEGVLCELDGDRAASFFRGRVPLSVRALHTRWETWCANHVEGCSHAGEMWRAFWEELGAELEIPAPALQDICALDFMSLFRRYPDTLPAFGEARRLGLRIGVLSNSAVPKLESRAAPLALAKLADVIRVPGSGVAVKPDRGAYVDVARLLGTSPDRCLFFDNEPTFVQAAREAGMTAFLVRRGPGLPQDDPSTVRDLSVLRALAKGPCDVDP